MRKQELYAYLIELAETAAQVVECQGEYGEPGREVYLDNSVIVKIDGHAENILCITVMDGDEAVFSATAHPHLLNVKLYQPGQWEQALTDYLGQYPPRQLLTFEHLGETTEVEILFRESS